MNSDVLAIILIIGLIALVIFLGWFFIFKVKHLRTPDVFLVDGGVKTGKSLVSVMLAIRQYRKNLLRYYLGCGLIGFINLFKKLFKKPLRAKLEKPMLYSNMPLYKIKYNYLSLDILCCKVRCPHKSVFLLDEASLIADSLTALGKTKEQKEICDYINEMLTLFLKVYVSHGTHGGTCIYNSQNIVDLHFAFRRNTSTYLYITKNRKFPFFCLLNVRELLHDEGNDVTNVYDKDVDELDKPLFVWKSWYRYYDRYYLDVLFKDLPLMVDYNVQKVNPRLQKVKLDTILTLGNYKKIREFNENQQKEGA